MDEIHQYALEDNAEQRSIVIDSAKRKCRLIAIKIRVEGREAEMGDPLEDLVVMYQSITRADDNDHGDGSVESLDAVAQHNFVVHRTCHRSIRARIEYAALVRYLESNGHGQTLQTFRDEVRERESTGNYPYLPLEPHQLDEFQVENL